jgi:type II secretory pathway component PulC
MGSAAAAFAAAPSTVAAPAPTAARGTTTAHRADRQPTRHRTGRAAVAAQPAATKAPTNKSGIVHVSGNTYTVPETLVNRYVSDPNALSSQAGATQVKNGWRLTSVKSGSRVEQLGLRSGDVITSVNGYGLGSLTSTWWAAQHLKNEDVYRVSIRRAGEAQTMRYEVVN